MNVPLRRPASVPISHSAGQNMLAGTFAVTFCDREATRVRDVSTGETSKNATRSAPVVSTVTWIVTPLFKGLVSEVMVTGEPTMIGPAVIEPACARGTYKVKIKAVAENTRFML